MQECMWEAEETTISAPDIQLGASITRHAARQHGHLHVRTVDVAIEVERHLERVLPLVARARLDPIQIDFKVLKRLQQLAKRACAGRQVQTRRNHSRPQTGVCRRAAADARARGVGGGGGGAKLRQTGLIADFREQRDPRLVHDGLPPHHRRERPVPLPGKVRAFARC